MSAPPAYPAHADRFAPPPVLETERLILREHRMSDFPAYAAFYADPSSEFVGGPLDESEAWRKMAVFVGHWTLRGYGMWALEDKATGAFAGQCGLWNPHGWPEPEVGYFLALGFTGRGLATEAAARARRYAYETLGWTRIASSIDPKNTGSVAVARRLGAWRDRSAAIPDGRVLDIYVHPAPEALGADGLSAKGAA